MKKYQIKFIEYILNKQILKFGKFKLKSGRISPYFFDISLLNTGRDLAFLGRVYAEALINFKVSFDVLFGPAYKGIPIAMTTAIALAEHHGLNISYCFNRKERKVYGEGGTLVGGPLQGRVMLIDDVITSGAAISESIKIITVHRTILAGAIISLDRQEKGYNEISAIQSIENDYHCQVMSIITMRDLIAFLKEKNNMVLSLAIQAYQKQYGV